MKKLVNKILLISAVSFLFYSCKKDILMTETSGGTTPSLNASASIFNLALATAGQAGGTFTWTSSDFGYQGQIVNYTLQYDTAGHNFANLKETSLGTNITSKTFTQGQLNGIALSGSRVLAGNPTTLDFRVKAYLGAGLLPVYSGKVTVQINTYDVVVFWYVPGDYQGWDPASAAKLGSSDLFAYEGFVNIPSGGTYQFKYTSDPDWNHTNYGWASSTVNGNNVSGTFNTTGGNLFVPTSGYFLMTANKNSNTWSCTRTTWSIIGDGASGWGTDIAMTYDAANKVWKATTTLNSSGQIKFRANNDWTLNLGIGANPAFLDYNGANISVPSSGSHTVILDLHNPRRYTYTIQ
jgi:starch-binding outer membrane protein SusE/F